MTGPFKSPLPRDPCDGTPRTLRARAWTHHEVFVLPLLGWSQHHSRLRAKTMRHRLGQDTRLREAGAEVVYCLTRGAPKGPNLPRVRLNHQDALFPGHGKATHCQTCPLRGDRDEDAVFEMKSSQSIARDANENSSTCQPATCERAKSAQDVDNGDRLQGPSLI
ncbi:hypothetical protein HPB47_001223, partial [Ixodes persulcatus]